MKILDLTNIKPIVLGYLIHGLIVGVYLWALILFVGGPINLYLHEGKWVWPTLEFAFSLVKPIFVIMFMGEITRWLYGRWFPADKENDSQSIVLHTENKNAQTTDGEDQGIIGDQWKLPPK
jgi:hypothetical protein